MQAVQETCSRGLRKPRLSEAKASFSQTERAGILLVPPTDKGLSSRPSVDFLFLLLASNTDEFWGATQDRGYDDVTERQDGAAVRFLLRHFGGKFNPLWLPFGGFGSWVV